MMFTSEPSVRIASVIIWTASFWYGLAKHGDRN